MGRGGREEGRGAWGMRLTRPFRRVAVKMFRRLSAKFMAGVGVILVITLALSIFVNTQVVERYYLRRQTGYVEAAGSADRPGDGAGGSGGGAGRNGEGAGGLGGQHLGLRWAQRGAAGKIPPERTGIS